ncbi:leucyl aminopeptidase family protein [Krasilnikovia sp. M28-CT-15]|uniref:leucyl aminopeptidase family protein n=1 Tax=Krasilnikovia sp. M28-CT-15 TaxID=3373540 RepID=UPI003876260B
MFPIRLVPQPGARTRVFPVGSAGPFDDDPADLAADVAELAAEVAELCRTAEQPGRAGAVQTLPRPLRTPAKVLAVGVGAADEGGWRAAGAAAARAAQDDEPLAVVVPAGTSPDAVQGLAEGLWLGGYRYTDGVKPPRTAEVELVTDHPDRYADALDAARAGARAAWLARDLTNAPSSLKNPAWFAAQVLSEAGRRPGLSATVWEPDRLAAEGFGGLLAVGGGSANPPRLVELCWAPPEATRHVVLVGKGITFDTGGISIKPVNAMQLMRKDMGGAAAVVAATLGAADLRLPVKVSTLVPLAENAVSGSAYRPGDVITHYDGTTSESTNTDAEGRLVLADALGYAVARLDPDVVVDLATLTGANAVALGARTAALYSHDDALAGALFAAGQATGERMWRMPLPDDYAEYLRSDIADRYSAPTQGGGSVMAAMYLREFLGDRVGQWAHLDMSAPSWAAAADGELSKGATGWGARMLLRWLSA